VTHPPRLATLLLSLALGRQDRRYVVADLAEEYAELAERLDRAAADRWYWSQVRRSIGPSLGRRLLRPRRLDIHAGSGLLGLETLLQDGSFAIKSFVRAPGFTFVAAATLAIGIGANVATFSLVHSTVLRPLPFKHADRIVELWAEGEQMGAQITTTPTNEMLDAWLTSAKSFDGLALYRETETTYTGGAVPEVLGTAEVSADLMAMLGVVPRIGRGFTPEDTTPASQPTVMLSEGYWRSRFGSNPGLVGHSMALDGVSHLVIGIVPEELQRLFEARFFVGGPKQAWLPLTLAAALSSESTPYVLARLAQGITVSESRAELDVIQSRIVEAGLTDDQWHPAVLQTSEMVSRRLRTALWILQAAVVFVLLIACANVANMLISRGLARSQEFAIRSALGAGSMRVTRQLLTEGMLLGLVGGVVGFLLASWCLDLVAGAATDELRELRAVRIEPMVLVFALGVTLVTGLVFSFAPALLIRHREIAGVLSLGGRGGGGGGAGGGGTAASALVRQALVGFQVAIALVLFLGAGLLINSFHRLSRVDPGFEPANLIALDLRLPGTRYPDRIQRMAFFEDMVDRVKLLPGAAAAAWSRYIPPDIGWLFGTIVIEGREGEPTNESPLMAGNYVSPDYFRAMGTELRQGQAFTPLDGRSDLRPVIVSQSLAQAFWPDGGILGQRMRIDSPFAADSVATWRTIVGVVEDMAVFGLGDDHRLQLYFPFGDRDAARGTVIVRATGNPADLVPLLEQQVWAIDPDLPINRVAVVERLLADDIARPRFNAALLGAFAVLALFLAAIGVYGVIALAVRQRTREIGVRVALGAQRGSVVRLIMGRGLRPIAIGMLVGVAAALALTRFLQSLLFQIQPTDPITYLAVIAILGTVGTLACYFPARRAMAVDPVEALRRE